ncbi:cytochrome P450 302a1, mitochondrial [Folsomia candida]|uniref:Cytochrome P450 302a1, mitochondrial n=1 Tax=Folsomia candida TaxID=158441 RepID=A0A226EX13_FOLCA|nr:cytochrome P450 302a1, mitochondrial [Folsomia candida]OXA62205.1 Cytochrome P450 302a1, mitochondrial [Folsomia candida]
MLSTLSFASRRSFATVASAVHQRTLKDIPGPSSFPIVGAVPHYLPVFGRYKPHLLTQYSIIKFREFGPIFKETMWGTTLVYLIDPDDIQTVLGRNPGSGGNAVWPKRVTHKVLEHVRTHELKSTHFNGGIFMTNGSDWVEIRHRHQKAMAIEEIGIFIEKCDQSACDLVSSVNSPSMKVHVESDFLNVLFAFATDYNGMSLFGEKWNAIDEYLDSNSMTQKLIWTSTELNHATGPTDHGSQTWRLFSTPLYKTILKGAQILDDVVTERLDRRLVNGELVAEEGNNSMLDTWIRDGHKDYRKMVTFLSDMVLASIDTVAYSLSYILYHISTNPRVQEKLFEELYGLNKDGLGAPITSDMLRGARYMKKCIKEALRINPLAVGVGRVLTEDTILSGYHVPEGTNIVILNAVTSRLPEYVEQPEAFIPERYDHDGKFKKIHPFVSLPFSFGPRSCVGRRLAEQAMNIFVFRLFRNYRLEWLGADKLDAITTLINKPDAPLLFKFTPRESLH